MRLYDILRAPKMENGVYIPGNFKPVSMKDAQRILLKYVKRDSSTSIRIVKKGGGYRDIVGRSSP